MRRRLLGSLVVACLLPACESQAPFETCQMNDRMKKDCDLALLSEQCEVSQTACYATCAVLDHPQCVAGPCMIYQFRPIDSPLVYQSGPFCTSRCDPTAANPCPANGQCKPALGGHYCVPNETVPVQP